MSSPPLPRSLASSTAFNDKHVQSFIAYVSGDSPIVPLRPSQLAVSTTPAHIMMKLSSPTIRTLAIASLTVPAMIRSLTTIIERSL
ncbi:hypothetical protein B0H67DRAFT_582935 [Lasiosphaeris hirsuta]|uniref:Uncharacterized protein n=1 Tax=Lasiosphaeris hirsuta TaxID=260670 RepID=A0AA40AIB4_9PEZI|nr:hypothetical protein B0H67DRAFT_582935 [Lasiosphaeris hirsuta]